MYTRGLKKENKGKKIENSNRIIRNKKRKNNKKIMINIYNYCNSRHCEYKYIYVCRQPSCAHDCMIKGM